MQENMWQTFCGKYVKVGVFSTEFKSNARETWCVILVSES